MSYIDNNIICKCCQRVVCEPMFFRVWYVNGRYVSDGDDPKYEAYDECYNCAHISATLNDLDW